MILTVTLNPSVDITYELIGLQLGQSNRVPKSIKTAGGKGLNVTRVLQQMDTSVTATGIIGGTCGDFICQQLDELGIKHAFYQSQAESRNNITIVADGEQTEILEAGPNLVADIEAFVQLYQRLLEGTSLVVISGSLPQGLDGESYIRLIRLAKEAGKPVFFDSSGGALLDVLQSNSPPTLIKPNEHELSELLGRKINSQNLSELKKALDDPLFNGIEWLVVSLGSAGAVIKRGNNFFKVTVPKIDVVSAIGSGDSVIAGLAKGISKGLADEEIIKLGMTFGVLNTLDSQPGHLKKAEFDWVFSQIKLVKI
ncbi:hexose kinase [Carnobacterium gallinarum]|uniref:hexose kinase n=1 Tax=Carnobacterium gallinarum TaxID=2749 RepID=UPI00055605E5|nr:hexose kinase [Carnobacterium gallinarum]